MLLFVRVVAHDNGLRSLAAAQIDRLMGHVRRDEKKVSGLGDDRLAESLTVAGFDAPLEHIHGALEVLVQMGLRRRAGDRRVMISGGLLITTMPYLDEPAAFVGVSWSSAETPYGARISAATRHQIRDLIMFLTPDNSDL